MTVELCVPLDDVTGDHIDFDRAADFVELAALISGDCTALLSDFANQVGIGMGEDHADLDEEMRNGVEEIVYGTIAKIEHRQRVLRAAYPFELDGDGSILAYAPAQESLGPAAYTLSLLLSNLRSMSPILDGSGAHPNEDEIRTLRQYFQFFATAALAAEIQGRAWSFGFPRLDRSGFISKLREIWEVLRDGVVGAQAGAPRLPKDDQVDVFAARSHPDGLPGFPLAVAQVATGRDAREKSLKGHLGAFKSRWFVTQPVTDFAPYMIVPFAKSDHEFIDAVRVMGNILHRLRVPRRVAEAEELVAADVPVEGYEELAAAASWIEAYRGW